MVSSRVMPTINMKNATAMISSMALNLTSQYKFMKNAATKKALTKAIDMAVTTSNGGGIATNLATTTVMMNKQGCTYRPKLAGRRNMVFVIVFAHNNIGLIFFDSFGIYHSMRYKSGNRKIQMRSTKCQ